MNASTTTANLPARREKPQVVAGAPVTALVPRTIDEAFRLAGALALSGLAPKGMEKPEQVMVAIMAGAELGLAPFQSMQSFAVINGRPTLWGDALVGVVRARGVRIREWIEGAGDDQTGHCEVTRSDTGEVIERTFSVRQAKQAGLWQKRGRNGEPTPWITYPERMLQMRARAFALRDGCGDMLRGVQVREEVDDYDVRVISAAPAGPGLAERLRAGAASAEGFNAAAFHAPEGEQDFEDHAEEIADADFDDDGGKAAAQLLVRESEPAPITGFASADSLLPEEPAELGAWADWVTKTKLATFTIVRELNQWTDAPEQLARFAELGKADREKAKTLAAAVAGRRKALKTVEASA